jgi:hypothetical protein
MPKKSTVKTIIVKRLWSNAQWTVRFGRVNAGRGSTGAKRLFRVVGEKLPFEAIHAVEKYVKSKGMPKNGVYLAHDSMGCPRYIGRGRIFSRLVARQKAQVLELKYFSFYVVEEKKHEREIETLLIRAAGPLLEFNTKKKRVTIRTGSLLDYESGTKFFERRYERGQKPKRKKVGW